MTIRNLIPIDMETKTGLSHLSADVGLERRMTGFGDIAAEAPTQANRSHQSQHIGLHLTALKRSALMGMTAQIGGEEFAGPLE